MEDDTGAETQDQDSKNGGIVDSVESAFEEEGGVLSIHFGFGKIGMVATSTPDHEVRGLALLDSPDKSNRPGKPIDVSDADLRSRMRAVLCFYNIESIDALIAQLFTIRSEFVEAAQKARIS